MIADAKFFEAAQTLTQSLSQWDLLITGASLVMIVSTSYYRPDSRRMRAAYFLLLPAWGWLAYSIYQGILVQRYYVAYLVAAGNPNKSAVVSSIASGIETATGSEIQGLEDALVCLGIWLLLYITWWVLSEQPEKKANEK